MYLSLSYICFTTIPNLSFLVIEFLQLAKVDQSQIDIYPLSF
jgi:hypothetical protein